MLPSWNEVARSLEDQADALVAGLQSAGWRKSCAVQLVEYVSRQTASRRERRREADEAVGVRLEVSSGL